MPAEAHTNTYTQQDHAENNSTSGNNSRATHFHYLLKTKFQSESKQQEDNTYIRPCLNIRSIHYGRRIRHMRTCQKAGNHIS